MVYENLEKILRNIASIDEKERKYLETNIVRYINTFQLIPMRKGLKILDVGVGPGHLSILIRVVLNAKVYGIDIRNHTNERAARFHLYDIHYKMVNIEKEIIPYEDEYFDVVLFTETIEHLNEPQIALKEIRRVLHNEGFLILTTPLCKLVSVKVRNFVYRIMRDLVHLYPQEYYEKGITSYATSHVKEYTFRQLKRLVDNCNFKVKEAYLDRTCWILPNTIPPRIQFWKVALWKVRLRLRKLLYSPTHGNIMIKAIKV